MCLFVCVCECRDPMILNVPRGFESRTLLHQSRTLLHQAKAADFVTEVVVLDQCLGFECGLLHHRLGSSLCCLCNLCWFRKVRPKICSRCRRGQSCGTSAETVKELH